MSDLSTHPQPFKLVLKPSTYQSKDTKGGLNLNKWIKKFLARIGFAITTDCCTYYPTMPVINVLDDENVTPDEMANVPILGMFIAQRPDSIQFTVYIKGDNLNAIEIAQYND